MTASIIWRDECDTYENSQASANGHPQGVLSRAALACIVVACAWVAWSHLSNDGSDRTADWADQASEQQAAPATTIAGRSTAAAGAYAKLASALKNQMRRSAALASEAALFDSRFSLGFPPGSFAIAEAVKGDREPVATGSLGDAAPGPVASAAPVAAPAASLRERVAAKAASAVRMLRAPQFQTASLRDDGRGAAAADAPAHEPTIFERLFGKPAPLTLASAAPDDGGLGAGQGLSGGRYDQYTAVYDISSHTVYMPDGSQLEAHSGLGSRFDDVRYVNERMRGPTPPAVYDLKLREASFHGVQAIRLIPANESEIYGRNGLLAHTYMLGPRGDSNGCVSFRNYNAFLQAYLNQKIKRLAVVTHL
jgi:type VI secretion system (T6SS) effector TldE1-like protein